MQEREREPPKGSMSVRSMLLQPGTVLPGGYEIVEWIGAGGMGEVLLARTVDGGRKVAVKVLHGRSDAEPERFDREARAAARIRHPNVVEFLDAGQTVTGLSFYVMEYLDGETLAATLAREGAMPPWRACSLTLQILSALEAAHQRGVIHRDLKPGNCLRMGTPGAEIVKLLDFGIAKVATDDAHDTGLTRTGSVIGTPSYMSPEQAMGGEIDARADIYSAGVILFELLTGQVPFASSSPMGVLTRHINDAPPSPRLLAPEADIDVELERVVLQALSKRREDRFARAAEFAEAIQRVMARARRAALPSGSFRRPERLYGRGRERATLLEAFGEAVAGRSACVLLTGDAGVGKTALVVDAIGPRARLVKVALDPHDLDARSQALLGVFRQLVARVAPSDREIAAQLRHDLEAELGLGLRVLVALVPELEALVGPQPAPPPAGSTEAHNRLQAAMLRALRVFARVERPLVLFIDDLQWATAATVDLLIAAAGEAEVEQLLVVATLRDGEVDPASRLGMLLHELGRAPATRTLHVGALHLPDVAALVGDALGVDPTEVDGLARELLRRTEGNPLFVHQLLRVAHDAGILAFDAAAQQWRWQLERAPGEAAAADGLDGTDRYADVDALIGSQLARLPEPSRELLAAAACASLELDLGLLGVVLRLDDAELRQRLEPAVALELVERHVPFLGRSDERHRFAHERIRQAALGLLDPDALPGLHLRIGRWLASQGPGSTPSLTAIAHMNRGRALVTDPQERRTLAHWSLEAARQARGATDYEGASRFLEAGVSLLSASCWQDDPSLAFALHLERADCAYLAGDFARAEPLYAALAARAATPVEALEVDIHRVTLHLARGAPQESLALGLAALDRHGVQVPESREARAAVCEDVLARIRRALADREILALVDAPRCEHEESRALLRLLTELIAPAHLTEDKLADVLICELVELSLARGSSEASPYAYALFAFFLATRRPDAAAHDFGRLALALHERLGDPGRGSRIHFVFGSILHLFEPLPAALGHFDRALALGLEAGDHVFASYACSHTLIALIGRGVPLPMVRERARQFLQITGRTRVASSTAVVKLALRVVACLQGETNGPAALGDQGFDEDAFVEELVGGNLGFATLWYQVIKLQLLYLEGDLQGAAAALAEAERRLMSSAWFLATELAFYRCMLLAAQAREADDALERVAKIAALRAALEPITRWAVLCPETYAHKQLLVEAELAALEGRVRDAAALHDRAVVRARADGFISTEALAAERAAVHAQSLGQDGVAGMYAGVAEAAYHQWGATRRASLVRARHGTQMEAAGWPTLGGAARADRDVAALPAAGGELFARAVALSKILADEDDFDRLSQRVLEHVVKATKTDRGLLAIERGGVLCIEAAWSLADDDRSRSGTWELGEGIDAPTLPLKRAYWTGEVLLVDDVVDNVRFSNDTYLQRHRPRSILCLPLRAYGRRFGLLYLESRETYAHLAPGMLDLLGIVATQLAVAVHTARPDSGGRLSERIRPDDATRSEG